MSDRSAVVVIGDIDSVLGFGALGATVMIPAPEADEVRAAIGRALADRAAVIFITAQLAGLVPDTIGELSKSTLPAVMTLPDASSDGRTGLDSLDEIIVRATGSRPDHKGGGR